MVALLLVLVPCVLADEPLPELKGIKAVEAVVEPTEAKPGQTVTLKLTVDLQDGFYTYATKQTDKNALEMVNTIKFPKAGDVVFVGEVTDPAVVDLKAEPLLGIKELKTYKGKVVYERKAVINPAAKAGEVKITLPGVVLQVCNDRNCFPLKSFTRTATVKVTAGPAVPVEAKYKDEVEKALTSK
jgi:hypothetical protein